MGWTISILIGFVVIFVVGFLIQKLLKIHHVRSQQNEVSEFLRQTTGEEETAVTGKTYLCLVNPYSGANQGLVLFEQVTKPMFLKAGAQDVFCVVTQRAGHFGELGKRIVKGLMLLRGTQSGEEENLEWEEIEGEEAISLAVLRRLDGVLMFGGDGSLFEFLNGVVEEATNGSFDLSSAEAKYILGKLNVGVCPCGTGNGIAASYGARTVMEASKKIVKGRQGKKRKGPLENIPSNVSGYDVVQVEYFDEYDKKAKLFLDCHYVSWGFIVQHDELVEREFRSWGSIKMLIAPLICIVQLIVYQGSIVFLPAPRPKEKEAYYGDYSNLPDSKEEGKEGWKVIEGPFVGVSVGCLSWAAHDMCIADGLEFDDGELVLLVVREGPSRVQIARALMSLSEVGAAQRDPYVDVYNCYAASLRCNQVAPFGASGENIPNTKSVDVTVCPSLARFLKD